MDFLTAKTQGVFTYYGHSYELAPITYPDVDIRNILVVGSLLNRVICEKNPDTMQSITFEAERLPGYPKMLRGSLDDLPDGSKLMLVRGGGIGDVIMLTPALKKLRQTLGDRAQILMSTFEDRIPLLKGLKYIDRFYPHPIRLYDFMQDADFYIDFSDPKRIFNSADMIDFHLDSLFFDPDSVPEKEKIPEISPDLAESESVRQAINSISPGERVRILYAGKASDMIRHLPQDILMLLAAEYPDMVFILPEDRTGRQGDRENIFTIDTSGGLCDYVSAIAQCDILVSADSSAYHIAAALNRPSLVFFGPISSRIRTGYYPMVVPLDSDYSGLTCHAPCGISALTETPPTIPIGLNKILNLTNGVEITTFDGRSFFFDQKKGCPESNATGEKNSPCLTHFRRERIMDAFEKVLAMAGEGTGRFR